MSDDAHRFTIRSQEDAEEAKAFARQYQHSNPNAAPAPSGFNATGNSVGQVYSVTMGGQNTTPDFQRVTTSDIAPRDESAGVLSTARSQVSGGPVSGRDITRETTVIVEGMETSVGAAAALGYLRINPSTGLYEDATQAASAVPQQGVPRIGPAAAPATPPSGSDSGNGGDDPANADGGDIPPFNEELESHIRDFHPDKIGNMDFETGLSQLISTGELTDNSAGLLASTLGLSADEVRGRATALRDAFTQQAMEMTGAGEGLTEILHTMKRINPAAVDRAIRDHVEQGKTNAYDGVIADYIFRLPQLNPQAILDSPQAQAMGVRLEKSGEITVAIDGAGRTSWQAAIRAGFIRASFR